MMPASTSGAGWRRLVVAAAALVLFDQAAAALVFGTAAVVPGFDPRWARTAAFGVAYVAANVLALLAAYQIAFAGRRPDLGRFGLGATRRVPSTVAGFIGCMLVVGPVAAVITEALGLGGTTTIDTAGKPLRVRLFVAVLAVLVAPWIEEISMRGLLFGALDARFGFWPGALVSGALWAGLHLTPGVLVIFTAEGVLLAWVRRRTGSVLTGVGLHGAQNAIATAVTGGGWASLPVAAVLACTIPAATRVPRRIPA